MAMSRKEFNAIADVIAFAKGESDAEKVRVNMAIEIANICKRSNPNFDRNRFLAACDIETNGKWF